MSSPGNGCVPVGISNSTAPNAQTSPRVSTVFPRACSGLMYAAVLRMTAAIVACIERVGDIVAFGPV